MSDDGPREQQRDERDEGNEVNEGAAGAEGGGGKGPKEKVTDGIRQGIGVLSAFKDALEETIQEARERGDISADKAREVMRTALDRAQEAAGSARERLDFATHSELEDLRARVAALETHLGVEPPAGSTSAAADAPAEGASEEA